MTKPAPIASDAAGGLRERATAQIKLGQQTGADGGGKSPHNIYVIAADLLAALSAPPVHAEPVGSRLEAELEEARTLDKGFYEWLIERDLIARGEEIEWGDIVVALTEHEVECLAHHPASGEDVERLTTAIWEWTRANTLHLGDIDKCHALAAALSNRRKS